MASSQPALPGPPSTAAEFKIDPRWLVYSAIVAVGLILLVIFIKPSKPVPPAPQQLQMVIGAGESLTQKIGLANAIVAAEKAGLPIQARLIGSKDLVTIKPADARKLLSGAATDVVLVTVKVHPGDMLAMTVDDKRRILPGSITYTAAR